MLKSRTCAALQLHVLLFAYNIWNNCWTNTGIFGICIFTGTNFLNDVSQSSPSDIMSENWNQNEQHACTNKSSTCITKIYDWYDWYSVRLLPSILFGKQRGLGRLLRCTSSYLELWHYVIKVTEQHACCANRYRNEGSETGTKSS